MSVAAVLLMTLVALPEPVVTTQPQPVIVEPQPESPRQIVWARVAVAAQMVGCGTDLSVTMYAMGTGNFTEHNPVWAWAENRPMAMGITKLGMCAAVSTALLHEHRRHPKRTIFIAAVLTGVSVWATARNAQTIRGRE